MAEWTFSVLDEAVVVVTSPVGFSMYFQSNKDLIQSALNSLHGLPILSMNQDTLGRRGDDLIIYNYDEWINVGFSIGDIVGKHHDYVTVVLKYLEEVVNDSDSLL